jgi:hypothetical protein
MACISDQVEIYCRAPEFAIVAERARAGNGQSETRRFAATRLRATKIVLAVVVGAAVGHGVEKAVVAPEWLDAAAGGALARGDISHREKSEVSINAEM